jgi:iron(III) transport system ATP-binding protein
MTALTIRGVTKSFADTPVLRGVDLDVPSGSLTAVLGPSGCGKTTLLRLVAGFAAPDAGTIAFDDRVVCGPGHVTPPQRRRVGYVPQEGALFPHLTVADNITFGLPRRARRARQRVGELLDLVGLEGSCADRFPHQLSGGQQQRVALARALAPEPALVLLDEPFASLDAGLREGTRHAVLEALRATGATAVLVTHDQAEALSMADQVAVLRDGRVVQAGPPKAVYESPSDLGVASFVGEAMVLPARVTGGKAECALGTIAVLSACPDGSAQVLIRPEQVRLHPTSSSVGVEARVESVSYYGHDAAVRLRLTVTEPRSNGQSSNGQSSSGQSSNGQARGQEPDGEPRVTARVLGQEIPPPGTLVRLVVDGGVLAYPETPLARFTGST